VKFLAENRVKNKQASSFVVYSMLNGKRLPDILHLMTSVTNRPESISGTTSGRTGHWDMTPKKKPSLSKTGAWSPVQL